MRHIDISLKEDTVMKEKYVKEYNVDFYFTNDDGFSDDRVMEVQNLLGDFTEQLAANGFYMHRTRINDNTVRFRYTFGSGVRAWFWSNVIKFMVNVAYRTVMKKN
jgi:hypothetical protein